MQTTKSTPMEALSYLLQVRASRNKPLDPIVLPFIAMVVIGLISVLSMVSSSFSWAAAVELNRLILAFFSLAFVTCLPVRQVQQDAALHASFFAGRCYDEVLGTRLSPRELVDPIAFHSLRECFRSGLRTALLLAGLWWVLAPAWWMWILLALPAWILGLTWFLLPASYATQQWTIYNSQLKAHSAGPMLERLFALITTVPMLAMLVIGFYALVWSQFSLGFSLALGYFLVGVIVARQLALAGIVRLPRLREKAQAMHRRWIGVRRNPFVYCWSDNPIVVRERQRDAGRVPGHWLGALLFQAPMAWGMLILMALTFSSSGFEADSAAFYVFLFPLGCAQLAFACRRSSGAIVDEAVRQSLETMQNTRLHASEFVSGWLQVAAIPRMVENLLIFAMVYGLSAAGLVSPPLALLYALIFVSLPLVGAALGLLASVAPQREKASAQMSTLLMSTFFGWYFCLLLVSGVLRTDMTAWSMGIFSLFYLGAVLGMSLMQFLNKIEVR